MKKKRPLSNKIERVILSDILPYEVPIIFSNRHLYDFLVENRISLRGNSINWKKEDKEELETIMKLLFNVNSKNVEECCINLNDDSFRTIPFGYKISHKDNDYRELNIIHPKNQLALIEFYEKFKELIVYYCGISSYSLRRPFKLAKSSYHPDNTHMKHLAHDHEHQSVEEYNKEYRNFKTYFVYKEISNIHKFFESHKYHRCEKKYDYLFKFDVAKCFDSIYTHSITWALLEKNIVKDKIKESNTTFGGQFDKLMQDLNHGETNGIIIGPEFSRIFAELILQKIDKNVEDYLRRDRKPSLLNRRDYEMFRYVDDIFLFYNDERLKDEILSIYRLKLKEFKLYVNDAKSVLLEKPIITGITQAKLRITDLLDSSLSFKTEMNEVEGVTEEQYSFYVSSNRVITRFKSIIKESDIEYKDIQNYTLACVDRKVDSLVALYTKIENKDDYERKVTKALIEILEFAFFLYSVSPKVNSTIKMCLTISKAIKFSGIKGNFNIDNRDLVYKKIYDEIFLVLKKYKANEYTQVETLYLLIALKDLGKQYRLSENVLCEYYGIDLYNEKCRGQLNYFSITVLLFYIENKVQYARTKKILEDHIIEKIGGINPENRGKYSEIVLLFFDLLVCPFLGRAFKEKILDLLDVPKENDIRGKIINFRTYWFTKWTEFDLRKELQAKKSQEVY